MIISNKREQLTNYLIIFSLVGLAFLIRAPGLGKWCLAVDEYYFSQSVDFILEQGVPKFPGGGYYVRGIALQYMNAVISMICKDKEVVVRLLPLIFGVFSIMVIFLLSRLFLPLIPAVLSSAMLLFSSWHIEFSRFGRMYAPFQMIFFIFLYAYYMGYWKNILAYKKASWGLAFISIFFYEGSIFLTVLLFLTLLIDEAHTKGEKVQLGIVTLLLLLINFFANKIGFRNLGVENALPPGLPLNSGTFTSKLPIVVPKLKLLFSVWNSYYSIIVYLILVSVVLYIYFKHLYSKDKPCANFISFISILLPMIHQFGLLISGMILIMLCNSEVKNSCFNKFKFWISYIFISALLWSIYGVASKVIWLQGQGQQEFLKELAKLLFLYPPFHADIIIPFAKSTPFWGILTLILLTVTTIHVFNGNRENPSRFFLTIIVVCSFMISMLKKPYHGTRYFFFFYPLIYILLFVEFSFFLNRWKGFVKQKKKAIALNGLIFIPFFFFLTTEDFNLHQVFNVSSKDINFRMGKYSIYSSHWYPRADFETPAQYVNEAYADGDIVVVDYSPISEYLKVPFINFISPELDRFTGEARKEGREQIWTGRPLIYDFDSLINIIPKENDGFLWLISIIKSFGGGSFVGDNYPEKMAKRYNLNVSLEYSSIDGRIGVWKIQKREAGDKNVSSKK